MEGESFYQTIIHNAPIGYVLFKLVYAAQEPVDLEFVEVNPAFEKIVGLTHEDVVGFGMSKFLPASKEFLDWISFCALVGQSDQAQEYLQYTPYRDCWYQGYVYSPKPGHVITLFYDVTEEKRISEQNSGLVSSLFDIIFELDQHLVVNNLYTGDEALLFLPREAIIGVQLPQLLPDKQLVAQLLKSCQDAERTGQPTNLEYHSILPDDKRWFRAIIVPVENVPAIKFRLVVRDITDQKTAENILKTFFMVASEFMCVVDQNYHLLYANQTIMKEARDKPDGVTGYHFTEFVYPDDIAATREAMKRVLDNGKGDGFVNRCGFDGVTWNYIEWQATYFDGLFYLAGRNISEKIAAEEEMRRDNDRLLKLVEVLQQPFSSFKELIDFALEQGMELTGSKMGSFYLYNEVNNELKIVAHTQNIKEMCQIKELSR
ncbi:MAG: PAS domain-containing protein, partial [Methylocystaceae bacterium]